MLCPKCGEPEGSIAVKILCSRDNPTSCKNCSTRYYLKRVFSGLIIGGFWYTGIGFISLFFAYSSYSWLGVIGVFLISALAWAAISLAESYMFSTTELTEEMEIKGNRYLLAVQVIVGVALAFFVFALVM